MEQIKKILIERKNIILNVLKMLPTNVFLKGELLGLEIAIREIEKEDKTNGNKENKN